MGTRRWWRWINGFGPVGLLLAMVLSSLPVADPPTVQAASPVRWGYYVTYAASSLTTLRAQVDRFTHISPWYFQLKEDGTLISSEQPATTALIRSRNVKILPMVQNIARYGRFRAMLDTPEKLEAVVNVVAEVGLRPEYDGIHIDFEAISGEDQDLLTDFMARLAARLQPAGKLVSQAVAAKTNDRGNGWSAPYNYSELAKYNDLIVIMAYDYHHIDGPPGPVAPLEWVQQVATYARSTLGADKTVLGMPLYGYDWPLTPRQVTPDPIPTSPGGDDQSTPTPARTSVAEGPTPTPTPTPTPAERGRSVTYDGAVALLARHNGERGYNTTVQSEWGRYEVDRQRREVWFESARSLRAKLEVMQRLKLAGFALWRLGQEDDGIWPVIREIATPAGPAPFVPTTRDRVYFNETRHTLSGAFLRYWRANGGLARFGYPLTEEFDELNAEDGQTYSVQYFERARFEFHPEHQGTPYEVLLGHLGRWSVREQGIILPPPAGPPAAPLTESRYFAETGRYLRGGFYRYWQANGGLAQFGLPLTEEVAEVNSEDGRTYVVQYFERARFEYHPENKGTAYEVLLGHLGRQVLRAREWLSGQGVSGNQVAMDGPTPASRDQS